MMPSPEKFSSRMRKLGIGDGNRVVVYDGFGLLSAARVWWMFRAMGHEDVAVLDGGLPKWKSENRSLSDMPPVPRERHFSAMLNNLMIANADQVHKNITSKKAQVFDARALSRFSGKDPEPRPGLRSGHIPESACVPFGKLLNEDNTLRSPPELRAIFDEVGYNSSMPIMTTCGSGITAAILALGLCAIGHKQVALYDGSWSEWGGRSDLPIET